MERLFTTEELGDTRKSLGERGEALAATFLEAAGYRLVLSNFKVPVGRNTRGVQVTGEIDLIAIDEDGVLCFVEVKTRSSAELFEPIAAVNSRKQRQITRTAKVYRRLFGVCERRFRYDVVSVVIRDGEAPQIGLDRGFWTDEKFKKRRWENEMWHEFR